MSCLLPYRDFRRGKRQDLTLCLCVPVRVLICCISIAGDPQQTSAALPWPAAQDLLQAYMPVPPRPYRQALRATAR